MNRFFNIRTKHATTVLVLIAWLFALASGIANACLSEEARRTHSPAAATDQVPHPHPATTLSEQANEVEGDAHQSPASKALCLDACDERTHYLPKQDSSLDPPDLAPLTVFAVVWIVSQPIASAVRVEPDNHADPFGIPIRLRYSRLTL